MEIERAFKQKDKVAYIFEDWERRLIAKALAPEIKKIEKKIQKIVDDPDNEGQATYLSQMSELRRTIACIQDMIQYLK